MCLLKSLRKDSPIISHCTKKVRKSKIQLKKIKNNLYFIESFHSQNDLKVDENFQTFDISEIPVLETELTENNIFDINVEILEISVPNNKFEATRHKKKSKPNKLYDEDETAVMFLTQSQTE